MKVIVGCCLGLIEVLNISPILLINNNAIVAVCQLC